MALIAHVVQSEGSKTQANDNGTVLLQPAVGKIWVFKELRHFVFLLVGPGGVQPTTLKLYVEHAGSGRKFDIYSAQALAGNPVTDIGIVTDKPLVASNAFPLVVEWQLSETGGNATWMLTFVGFEVDVGGTV